MKHLPLPLLRAALISSSIGVGLLAIFLWATLTNWFRYPLSLEANFVLVPVLVIIAAGVVVHVWAFRTLGRNYIAPYAAVASLVIASATTVVQSREAFGRWVASIRTDDADRNADQVTQASDGTPVVYHLELHNPFASSAKTYLVGTFRQRPFKVSLPIGRVSGYGDAIKPSDWLILSPTAESNIFVAKVTVDPSRAYTFVVDLDRKTATLQDRSGGIQ
jgi:hypothetical protein